MRQSWLAVGVLLLLGGCADAWVPTETRSRPIVDGTPDTTTTAALGLVRTDGGVCSAVLIAPHLVLTARQCVSSLSEGAVSCDTTTFSGSYPPSDVYVTAESSLRDEPRTAASQIIVPDEDLACGNDIAIVVLSEPFDSAEVTPFPPALEADVAAGDTYTLYGYGASAEDGSGTGTRRSSTGEVDRLST